MEKQYQLSPRGRAGWATVLVSLPLIALGAVFGLTDDTLVDGENSRLAQRYTAVSDGSAATAATAGFDSRFGRPGGSSTLVLHDTGGSSADTAELYGIAAGNLATHFGEAEVAAVGDYSAGGMDGFDAVVYLGTDPAAELPREFLDDVRGSTVPVLWAGRNIEDLAGGAPGAAEDFRARYGWDPLRPQPVGSDLVTTVAYGESHVRRYTQSREQLPAPRVSDTAAVQVLARAVCGDPAAPVPCDATDPGGATELPWIVRSGTLTHIPEVPLNDIDKNDLYLVFADLYYDLLAPGTEPLRQAAVRLEDVGPEADPRDLRAAADYLHAANVPFQVAVVPAHVARTPDDDGWYGQSLLDTPRVVEALKYMQARGGTLVQHGTTHQYGATDNPYSGRSGEDYEFYRYGCTDTEHPPHDFGECRNDSYITKIGPVAEDGVEQHVARIEHGRQIMIDAGLGAPAAFTTPHYAGSVNAYAAIAEVYDARYEQSDYYAGILSDREISPESSYGQRFPFTVHDVYGSTVYPETLGNITETEQNNHAVRDPRYLVDRAEAHLVVRESTASFFFHPYLDLDLLEETVEGIRALGYTFVPADRLR